MANNGFISTRELDFENYKRSLKQYLSSQDRFRDYDFDGSNLSTLLDVLSYNTYLNAFYLNMVGSEMFLDSASMRETVVSHAKELNYVPRSRTSSRAVVDVTLNVSDPTISSIFVPANFQFSSSIDGRTYLFTTQSSYVARNTGTFILRNIPIYEGRIVTERFLVSSNERYIIASENIDLSSLNVTVQNSVDDTETTVYSRAYDLYGLDASSVVYFIQGYAANKYEIVFGNGITGKSLTNGNIIVITYRECTADAADKAARFTALGTIIGVSTISVATVEISSGGSERESIDSIKFNAPRYFATQNRAITKSDYISLIRTNFTDIESINVFGGEELEQKQYGKVVIVTKPYGGEITSNETKNGILNFLNDRTSVTIAPILQDPDYFYLNINSTVYFNSASTNLNKSSIETLVEASMQSYNDTYLNDFGNDFRYSKFVSQIDSADVSILSNQTEVLLVKKITPNRGVGYTTIINFQNEIDKQNISTRLPAGHESTVTSSNFTFFKNSVNYSARIADDGIGNLFVYTTDLGEPRTILMDYIGTVDYSSGKVSLGSIVFTDYIGHIDIKVKTKAKDIFVEKTQILQINPADINITVVEE
jgi:hypothetical protein